MLNSMPFRRDQRGFVLLLLVLTVIIVGGAFLLGGIAGNLSSTQRQMEQAQTSNVSLLAARQALLNYASKARTAPDVTRGGPGYLPVPDSLANGNYNGTSDDRCLGNSGNGLPGIIGMSANKRCLGKFPWADLKLDLGDVQSNDPEGVVPWLAVSANLMREDDCLTLLNSDIVNFAYTSFSCPSSTQLPHPWLTVRDHNNNVVSDRVAALLILPGPPIQTGARTQVRSLSPLPQPADYLDAIALPLGCVASCVSTYDNAALTNQFVMVSPGTRYPVNSEDASKAGQPVAFNDVVIYITIDELMAHIERKVLAEMSKAVTDFKDKAAIPGATLGFPWASTFASPAIIGNFYMKPGTLVGLFPFFPDVTTPSPPGGYPAIQSGIAWNVTGVAAPAKNCVRVQTGPTRWINLRENIHTNIMTESVLGNTATCTWKGQDFVDCTDPGEPKPISKTFTRFSSSARCNTGSPIADTAAYSVTRTISIPNLDLTCNSAPTVTYQGATTALPQRRSWLCNSVTGTSTMTVNMTDVVSYSISPFTSTASISIVVPSATTTISNLRYQPLVPYWFYDNKWHTTALFALSPSNAPAAGPYTDCGGATSLTIGGQSSTGALVIQAGGRLPSLPATPTQTRPSANISDYLEGINAVAATSCMFDGTVAMPTSSRNDQHEVVKP